MKTDGTFLLPDVKQDTYDLDVAGLPNGYYLKSATLGTVDVTDGLNIGGENPTSPLVLQLSPLGARVGGVVLTAGGKQACSATVVLVPDGSRRSNQRFYQEADVDRTGHYVLRGIAPGDYKLFAFDDVSDVGYLDPGSLRIYENRGQSAHFGVGDRQTVLLRIILTGTRNP